MDFQILRNKSMSQLEIPKLFSKSNRSDLNLAMLMKLGKWEEVSEIMSQDENSENKNTKDE